MTRLATTPAVLGILLGGMLAAGLAAGCGANQVAIGSQNVDARRPARAAGRGGLLRAGAGAARPEEPGGRGVAPTGGVVGAGGATPSGGTTVVGWGGSGVAGGSKASGGTIASGGSKAGGGTIGTGGANPSGGSGWGTSTVVCAGLDAVLRSVRQSCGRGLPDPMPGHWRCGPRRWKCEHWRQQQQREVPREPAAILASRTPDRAQCHSA